MCSIISYPRFNNDWPEQILMCAVTPSFVVVLQRKPDDFRLAKPHSLFRDKQVCSLDHSEIKELNEVTLWTCSKIWYQDTVQLLPFAFLVQFATLWGKIGIFELCDFWTGIFCLLFMFNYMSRLIATMSVVCTRCPVLGSRHFTISSLNWITYSSFDVTSSRNGQIDFLSAWLWSMKGIQLTRSINTLLKSVCAPVLVCVLISISKDYRHTFRNAAVFLQLIQFCNTPPLFLSRLTQWENWFLYCNSQ